MILVVDSGSTKTDWIALDDNGKEIFSTQTLGLNPQMLSNEILNERIKNNFDIYKNRNSVNKLFFYGAGCGFESTQNRILKVFKSIFENSDFDREFNKSLTFLHELSKKKKEKKKKRNKHSQNDMYGTKSLIGNNFDLLLSKLTKLTLLDSLR